MNAIQFCEPNETCCVIEEPQSMDGVAIMTYAEIKRTNTQNPILFTGTYEECDQWRSQFTWDNPYLGITDEVSIANREHIPNWQYDNSKTVHENHKNFSEFCNKNEIALEGYHREEY